MARAAFINPGRLRAGYYWVTITCATDWGDARAPVGGVAIGMGGSTRAASGVSHMLARICMPYRGCNYSHYKDMSDGAVTQAGGAR